MVGGEKMSKLDTIIKEFDTDWYHDGQVSNPEPAQDKAKQEIKDLFKELVLIEVEAGFVRNKILKKIERL